MFLSILLMEEHASRYLVNLLTLLKSSAFAVLLFLSNILLFTKSKELCMQIFYFNGFYNTSTSLIGLISGLIF